MINERSNHSCYTFQPGQYITKGIELLVLEFEPNKGAGWLSCFIAVVFSLTVYYGMRAGHGKWGPVWARQFILDATFWAAIIWWSGFANIPGNMKDTGLLFLPLSPSWFPTAEFVFPLAHAWLIACG